MISDEVSATIWGGEGKTEGVTYDGIPCEDGRGAIPCRADVGSVQLTVMGGIPGKVIGVVKGGRVGIPGIVGGVGAGIVTPVKMGGEGAASNGFPTSFSSAELISLVGEGPKIAFKK